MNNLTRPTRLKILLAQRGMSQKDLAEIAGLEMYQVSLLCSGKQKNLMLETAKKDDLADCFLQGIWYIGTLGSNK